MSSGKKKKKSISARNATAKGAALNKAAAKPGIVAGVGKNALWLLPAVTFLISVGSSSLMKYPVGFGIAFGCVNGLIAFFGAQVLSGCDDIPWAHRLFEEKWGLVAISAALPAVSLLLMFAAQNMQPFGDVTVIAGDMAEEYVPFIIARNRELLSGRSMLYSDSFGLGCGFWAATVYNTANPLTLAALPLDPKQLPAYMTMMQLVKTALAGGAFAYFYMEKYCRKDLSACVFSAMYALMTYFVGNLINIIWMDCLVVFPLIILGLERLIKGKSVWLYVICLALAIISYYYIAFMICIYLIFYYILYNFINTEQFEFKSQMRVFVRFALSSILSAGMAGICLIPSAAAILQTTGNSNTFTELPLLNYSPVMLIGKFLWGSDLSFSNETLPNIYISIFGLVIAVLFWLCKGVSRRKKLGLSALLAVLVVSTFFSFVNFAWHGFHITIGQPYRYAFLISFTLLLMGAEVWESMAEISFEQIMGCVVAFTVVIMGNYFLDGNGRIDSFVISLILAMLSIGAVALCAVKRIGKNVVAVLALMLVFFDLTISGIDTLKKIDIAAPHFTKEAYSQFIDMNSAIVESIKVSDSDIYRIEDENYTFHNQSMYFDHGSLTGYSTPNNGRAIAFMDAMGYAGDHINKYNFNLYVPFSDSVLNMKYLMSGDSSERRHLTLTDIESMGKHVYRNDLALPRAFAVSGNVENWNTESGDPFEVQNSLGQLATGESEGVYDIIKRCDKEEDDGSFVIESEKYSAVYEMPRDGDLYCYFCAPKSKSIIVSIGKQSYNVEGNICCVFPLYSVKKGDKLTVTFFGDDGMTGYVSAALENESTLLSTVDKMSQYPVNFEKYADGLAEGNITVDEDCILFTSIPYEIGWSAELDGKPTDIVKIGGYLIGIRLHPGENHIKLSYSSTAFVLGLWSTLISLAIFAAMILKTKIHFISKMSEKINNTH